MYWLMIILDIADIVDKHILVGGCNPSEKYARQLGCWHSKLNGTKKMFQTTNQLLYGELFITIYGEIWWHILYNYRYQCIYIYGDM